MRSDAHPTPEKGGISDGQESQEDRQEGSEEAVTTLSSKTEGGIGAPLTFVRLRENTLQAVADVTPRDAKSCAFAKTGFG